MGRPKVETGSTAGHRHAGLVRGRFFTALGFLFLGIVIVGFARTFYLRPLFGLPRLPSYLTLHGVVLSAWFLVVAAQVYFVATHRTDVHRKLGRAGVVLAPCVVVISLYVVAQRDVAMIDEAPFRGVPNLISLMAFSMCVGAALLLRKRPQVHKRLMIIGCVPVMAPALDRVGQIPVLATLLDPVLPNLLGPPGVALATLGALGLPLLMLVYDLVVRGRPHPATVYGILAVFMAAPLVTLGLVRVGAWAAFVRLVV